MTQHQSVIKGGWLEAKRAELVAAIPDLHDATVDVKLGVVEELRVKLEELREWDRWDPHTMDSVVEKREYKQVAEIGLRKLMGGVRSLHALPDGRIVSGGDEQCIRIWSTDGDGEWVSEALRYPAPKSKSKCDMFSVDSLQVLPDGRIVVASSGEDGSECMLSIWSKGSKGEWQREDIKNEFFFDLQALPGGQIVTAGREILLWQRSSEGSWEAEVVASLGKVSAWRLQVLADGSIVSGDGRGGISIHRRAFPGGWSREEVRKHSPEDNSGVSALQVFLDGRIASAHKDGTIRVFSKDARGSWDDSIVARKACSFNCLQALPDGRLVSGNSSGSIHIWSTRQKTWWERLVKKGDSMWQEVERIGGMGSFLSLQVLPDGRIVTGTSERDIRIFDGTPVSGGAS